MTRKFRQHPINFRQRFFSIFKEQPLYTIHRFNVYAYMPTDRKAPPNVYYFILYEMDFQTNGEYAIMGICDYEVEGTMKQDSRMIIKNCDAEIMTYVKLLLLERLEQETQKKLKSTMKKGMVEITEWI